MKNVFGNTKILIAIRTAIITILMILGAFLLYIIVDGGSLQDIIEDLQYMGFTVSVIGVYMALCNISTSVQSYRHAMLIVEESDDVKNISNENAIINNKLSIKDANNGTKRYNEEKFREKQEDANLQRIRKLTIKVYGNDNELKLDKLNKKIEENKDHKLKLFFLKAKKLFYYNKFELNNELEKLKAGLINAKVKHFKPIKRKDFTSINLEITNDKRELLLKPILKKKTIGNAAIKGLISNIIYSCGLYLALQSLIVYDYANKWIGLLLFIGFFLCMMVVQYIYTYITTVKFGKLESIEILKNRQYLLKYCEKSIKVENETN